MKNIICDEAELVSAINKIDSYIDFLIRSIDTYINILADIQGNAIQDDLINKQLSEIADSIQPIREILFRAKKSIHKDIRGFIDEIEEIDNFKFPNEIETEILALIGCFM